MALDEFTVLAKAVPEISLSLLSRSALFNAIIPWAVLFNEPQIVSNKGAWAQAAPTVTMDSTPCRGQLPRQINYPVQPPP